MAKANRGSKREQDAVAHYIESGFKNKIESMIAAGYTPKSAKVSAHKVFARPHIVEQIQKVQSKASQKLVATFERKIEKLWNVADVMLPDDPALLSLKKPEEIKAGITSIAELNKMQGDLAAEKRVNVNLNADGDIVELNQFLDMYRREY